MQVMFQLARLLVLALLLAPALHVPAAQSAPAQAARSLADLVALQKRIQQTAEKVRPTVVGIRMGASSGSGCLISEDGWISTAGHVIGTRIGTRCRVILHGGEVLDAETFGWHEGLDYGLIKADTKGKRLPFAQLGDSTKVASGEWLIAMGHPLGPEPGRDAVVRAGRCLSPNNGRGLIVMDAPVISGDSGGPVFNLSGEIIAINQSIQTNNVSVNNVTPSVPFREMVPDFKARKGFGNAQRPQWGRGTGAPEGALNAAERRQYEGAVRALQNKDFKSACDVFDTLLKAPKRPADVLYNAACAYSQQAGALKGKEAEAWALKALAALSRASDAGWSDMAHVDQDTDLDPIRERKDFKEWVSAVRRGSQQPVLGLSLRSAGGLRVDEVVPGSVADRAGLQRNDIIERVGSTRLESITDWMEWSIQKGITEAEPLRIRRAGRVQEVPITVPSFGARVFGQGGGRIMETVEGGLAFNAGLQVNDVIVRVGDTKVENGLEFANAMMMAPGNDEVELEVRRGFKREKLKFSYSTGEMGGSGGVLSRDDWKQGARLLGLWDKSLSEKHAGTVFAIRQKGKQVAFATVVRKNGLLLTKASQIDVAEPFELMDGSTGVTATLVARNDRYDLALIKVEHTFTREISFAAKPQQTFVVGTLLASLDARGRALAHGVIALPDYDSDKTVGEPDPNGPFMGIGARDAEGGGAEITNVSPGQPADRGGLKVGDVVRSVNGQQIENWASMLAMIQSRRADETIRLEVQRGSQKLELSVALVSRAQALGQQAPSRGTGKAELGLQNGRPRDGGVEIGSVRPGSPAELAGINSGELLLKIDDRAVTDQRSIDAAVAAKAVGDKVTLTLRRGGAETTVEVELAEQDAPPPPPGGGRPNVKGPINTRHTHFGPVIQHDGVVLPSQQGSPILDVEGNVVGLNIARADRTRTFALSAHRVGVVLSELIRQIG